MGALESSFESPLGVYLNGLGTMKHIINEQGPAISPIQSAADPQWYCSDSPTPAPVPSPTPSPSPSPSPTPSPASWQPCSGGVCCNPHLSPAQFCPDGEQCQPCGGGDACQCPGAAVPLVV